MRNLSFVKRMTALAMALMFLVASNVTSVEAAPANNLTPEQIEAIVRNMYDKFAAFDAQRTTDCFAPDGTIEDSVGSTPIQGTQAILAYQQSFPTLLAELRFQSVDMTVGAKLFHIAELRQCVALYLPPGTDRNAQRMRA